MNRVKRPSVSRRRDPRTPPLAATSRWSGRRPIRKPARGRFSGRTHCGTLAATRVSRRARLALIRWIREWTAEGRLDHRRGRDERFRAIRAPRAHGPNASAVRVTFESTCHGGVVSRRRERSGRRRERVDLDSGREYEYAPRIRRVGSVRDEAVPIVSLPPGRPWLWTGPVTRSFSVPSGATGTLDLVATAFAPGVFALGDYKLVVQALSGSSSYRNAAASSRRVRRAVRVDRARRGPSTAARYLMGGLGFRTLSYDAVANVIRAFACERNDHRLTRLR